MITNFLKISPAIGPNNPVIPPSSSTAAPQQPPADPQPFADPAAEEQAPKQIIPINSEHKDEICSGNCRAAAEEAKEKKEAEVTSVDKAETPDNVIVFPANIGDPSDIHTMPKVYDTKFFHKLTEAEKWELEQNLLNSMLNNAWSKSSEIEQYKKKTYEFLDNLLCKRKVNHSPSSPQVSWRKPNLFCTLIL
jgi:hypothetical protein